MSDNINRVFGILGKSYMALGVASMFASLVCPAVILIKIRNEQLPNVVAVILGTLGFFSLLFGIGISALFLYGGHCLLKRKKPKSIRLVALVSCMFVPLGTVLGISTLLLLKQENGLPTMENSQLRR